MPTTITTDAGTFEISKIPSNSHYHVRHLESGKGDVYTASGLTGTSPSVWPYDAKEIRNAVRAMSATRLERRRRQVVNAA